MAKIPESGLVKAAEVRFVANLCRDSREAIRLSGDGRRCAIELEAFDLEAAKALVMAVFAGRDIEVTVKLKPE